jgi:hypothetical protein
VVSAPAAVFGIISPMRPWHDCLNGLAVHLRTCCNAWGVVLLWVGCLVIPSLGADSCYDVLHLRDRSTLTGICLGRDTAQIYMAVRRQSLEGHTGAWKAWVQKANEQEVVACEQLRDRISLMLDDPSHQTYRFLLEQESDRVGQWLQTKERIPSELILLAIPPNEIAKFELVSQDKIALAIWSWNKQLDAPELKEAAALQKELENERVDLKQDLPDLGRRFQAVPQSTQEWQARLALVRYSRDREVEFQGTSGMMIRTGDRNAQVDVAKLLTQGLQQQSQDLLSELLDGRKPARKDWLEDCQCVLKDEAEDYFRATHMEQDILSDQGNVESVFQVRLDGVWTTIWRVSVEIDPSSVPAATQDQVANDPQVRSLMTLVESMGIGSTDTIDRALRTGAATMQSQQRVNQQFEFFRQRFQHRLDVPVLRWDISAPDRRSFR